jgi:hypothetical protein
LNSFQEKIEKNMVNTKYGKYMIKASTVLYITLLDFHQSRQQYGNDGINNNNNLYEEQGNYINNPKEEFYQHVFKLLNY